MGGKKSSFEKATTAESTERACVLYGPQSGGVYIRNVNAGRLTALNLKKE